MTHSLKSFAKGAQRSLKACNQPSRNRQVSATALSINACLLATLSLLLHPGYSVAGSVATLKFDPFRKPNFATQQGRDPGSLTPPISAWNPKMRATMVAGKNSMANVDGTIVKVGEKFQGYKLLEVRRRSAIFTRDGKHFELILEANGS